MRRPVLRYFGGKFRLRKWIISHFPPHRIYTEVYGGAASVLMSKPRSEVEIYNDINKSLFILFKVLRNNGTELKELLELTPYSRDEYMLSQQQTDDELELARRTVVRYWFSMSTDQKKNPKGSKGGFRSYAGRNLAKEWRGYLDTLSEISRRLELVYIENDSAVSVLHRYDKSDTLHYVDPPYVHSTRSSGGYDYEMTDAEHEELASALHSLKGMVVLSGYNCELYKSLFEGWERIDKTARAASRSPRVESLWLNPNASQNNNPSIARIAA